MPARPQEDSCYQAALPRYDYQECKFYLRLPKANLWRFIVMNNGRLLIQILTFFVCGNSLRNTSPSKSKCLMTRGFADDSELQTTRAPPEWSLSFARCLWDLMRAGIRFSLTCLISRAELTVPTISKLWESRSTLTAVFVVSTSQTDSTPKMSFPQSSSCSFQLPASPRASEHPRSNADICSKICVRGLKAARQRVLSYKATQQLRCWLHSNVTPV